jgi:hypothetical protein
MDEGGKTRLFGRRVYVDLNLGDSVAGSQFLFGNLERFVVCIGGGLRVRRNLQSQCVEYGQARAVIPILVTLIAPFTSDRQMLLLAFWYLRHIGSHTCLVELVSLSLEI